MILGHAHPACIDAVPAAAGRGLSFGTPGAGEVALAEEIVARVAPVEQVRLVSSGTEATMSAIRLARGFTGRSKIVKFAGCYHGHVDALLAAAGSGVATFALPDSAGVTAATTAEVIVLPYNDIDAVRAAFAARSRARSRRSSPRPRRRTWGWCRRCPGFNAAPRRDRPRRRRAADLRRGDDRLPAEPGGHVRSGRRQSRAGRRIC